MSVSPDRSGGDVIAALSPSMDALGRTQGRCPSLRAVDVDTAQRTQGANIVEKLVDVHFGASDCY